MHNYTIQAYSTVCAYMLCTQPCTMEVEMEIYTLVNVAPN